MVAAGLAIGSLLFFAIFLGPAAVVCGLVSVVRQACDRALTGIVMAWGSIILGLLSTIYGLAVLQQALPR